MWASSRTSHLRGFEKMSDKRDISLSLAAAFWRRHSRQNEWRHGKVLGLLTVSKHNGHSASFWRFLKSCCTSMVGPIMRNLIRNELLSWTLDLLCLCNSRNSSAPIGRQLLSITTTVVVPFFTLRWSVITCVIFRESLPESWISKSRLFTVRSTRSSALRYGLLPCVSVKTTAINPDARPLGKTRYIQTISRKNSLPRLGIDRSSSKSYWRSCHLSATKPLRIWA